MEKRYNSPPLTTWLPFGLWRVDKYFSWSYVKTLVLIIAALATLVTIGDVFQRFDDIIIYSRNNNLDWSDTAAIFLRYYTTFVPQLILQHMFPLSMLLAAAITATASYAGPRGNNEYTVLRSVGVSASRAMLPLIVPALLFSFLFQATRDNYLPFMVRESSSIHNTLRDRTSTPVDISLVYGAEFHTAAIGWFGPDWVGHNMILEVRNLKSYQRGDVREGDNDFVAYRATSARLEQRPEGLGFQWVPLTDAEAQVFTRFSRRIVPWDRPIPTNLTPAMIDRQTLGDAVCSWQELYTMQKDNSGARFEIHWRLSEPIGACVLMVWGMGICMGRMLRGKGSGYVQAVAVSMLATAAFYGLRLFGKSLWESALLAPAPAAWLPILLGILIAIPIALWVER